MQHSPVRRASGWLAGFSIAVVPVLWLSGGPSHEPERHGWHDFNPPPHYSTSNVARIVAFGSSSTRGYGASDASKTYPSQLQQLVEAHPAAGAAKVEIVNRGISGEDILDMMRRIKGDILARRPALVIWQVGSNDGLRGVTTDRFKAGLRAGIAAIRDSGSAVVLMGPQWLPAPRSAVLLSQYVAAVQGVGREEHVPVIDRYALMQQWMKDGVIGPGELIGADGLHMTDRGYALLAGAVYKCLASVAPQWIRVARTEAAPG